MKTYKDKLIPDYSLKELQAIDWELGVHEEKYKSALEHRKFEKLKPKPTIGQSFLDLRQEIRSEIERKQNA